MSNFNPYRLSGNAAIYSLDGPASDATYIKDGSNRIQLVADRSGNSRTNCLVLPGVAGNYASFTVLPAFGTGNFTITARIFISSLSNANTIFGGAAASLTFRINASTGYLQTAKNSVSVNSASTASLSLLTWANVAYVRSGTVGTYYINGVSSGVISDSFDYSLGNINIGAYGGGASDSFYGNIQFVRVYNYALTQEQVVLDYSGSVQTNCSFNADFSKASKLATSFTESSSNAATVTINKTAIGLPARIIGERDVTWDIAAGQPIFSVVNGYNTATFNGTSSVLKSAPFAFSGPNNSVYFVGSQVTFSPYDSLFSGDTSDSGELQQYNTSPKLAAYSAAALVAKAMTPDLPLGVRGVVSVKFSPSSGCIRLNRNFAPFVNTGTGGMNGITVGAYGNGTSRFGSITVNSIVMRSADDGADTQIKIAASLMRQWGISG